MIADPMEFQCEVAFAKQGEVRLRLPITQRTIDSRLIDVANVETKRWERSTQARHSGEPGMHLSPRGYGEC